MPGLYQNEFITTYAFKTCKHRNKTVADKSLIAYASPFHKFRIDVIMSNVTSFLAQTGNYHKAEYLDRDRQYCLN